MKTVIDKVAERVAIFPAKIRIFVPVLVIIALAVFSITYYAIYASKQNLYDSVENYLQTEVRSLKKMFEREYELKLDNAQNNLKVIFELFYQEGFEISDEKIEILTRDAQNIIKPLQLNRWFHGGELLHNNFDFVDKINQTVGCKATIFQKTDIGFVRISTNVMDNEHHRAVGTFIPFDSPIVKSIYAGEPYFGRAYVVNDWYVTGYGALKYQGEIVGMLFVGTKEKDLPELSKKFEELNIGKSGYPFVFDRNGKMVINHSRDRHNWEGLDIIDTIIQQKNGVIRYLSPVDNKRKIIAFDYFPEFDFYIAAFVDKQDETRKLISHLVSGSIIVSIIMALVIALAVYFMTIEKLHNYLETLESRDQELASAREALKQSEKLATMGQLSAGIAHEVNNPLGVVLMYSHILMEECDPDSPMYKDLENIATQAARCKKILSGLLNFARKNEINKKQMRIDEFFEQVQVSLVFSQSVDFSISHASPDAVISIDPDQMTQVIVNLVNNAIDAINSEGSIHVETGVDKSEVVFTVTDSGSGITEENRKHLFEPFFSTKQIGKGTGLGLAVCYGIVKMHSGKIEVESNTDPQKGKTFSSFIVKVPKG